ncbi:MAG TPA: DUF1460 domain-containing protein [Smithellaceae bacterium]|nr:DUF1460 domain-containing protein [Smithellaceae bacterium]
MMIERGAYGEWLISVARIFLGAPYRAATLEKPGPERLRVELSAFDCVTYVETVLALSACADQGKISQTQFRKNLQEIRYRGGKIEGFASRLHYFSDWISDNEKKRVVAGVSKGQGGAPLRKKISFMTSHRDAYPALKQETEFQRMQEAEKRLSRKAIRMFGRSDLLSAADRIFPGDIVAFVTNAEGLDVAHVGFAVKEGRALRLMHASRKEGKVAISGQTLSAYVKARRSLAGVIIARPLPGGAWKTAGR